MFSHQSQEEAAQSFPQVIPIEQQQQQQQSYFEQQDQQQQQQQQSQRMQQQQDAKKNSSFSIDNLLSQALTKNGVNKPKSKT